MTRAIQELLLPIFNILVILEGNTWRNTIPEIGSQHRGTWKNHFHWDWSQFWLGTISFVSFSAHWIKSVYVELWVFNTLFCGVSSTFCSIGIYENNYSIIINIHLSLYWYFHTFQNVLLHAYAIDSVGRNRPKIGSLRSTSAPMSTVIVFSCLTKLRK